MMRNTKIDEKVKNGNDEKVQLRGMILLETIVQIILGVFWPSEWWKAAAPGKLLPHPPSTG